MPWERQLFLNDILISQVLFSTLRMTKGSTVDLFFTFAGPLTLTKTFNCLLIFSQIFYANLYIAVVILVFVLSN
jgi:hypothetical protein